MTNNDILRRLRYMLDLSDQQVAELFELGGQRAELQEVTDWTRSDEDPLLLELTDYALATFLNGLIADKRGQRPDGPEPAETAINNNLILRKLKIAFKLKTNEIQAIYTLAGRQVSEHEITAFFRRPDQRQYRICNDQYLRWFLSGLQKSFQQKKFGLRPGG